MYRMGCCRTGPAGFGQSEVAAEQGGMTTLESPAVGPPGMTSPDFPWGKLFGVSVLAGLTISWLTKPKR